MVCCNEIPVIISISESQIIAILKMYTELCRSLAVSHEWKAKYEESWLGEGSVMNAACSKDHIQINSEFPLVPVFQLA
jgi:hypothetical protein